MSYDINYFVSSDHHFFHGNILKYSKRYEFCTKEEINIMENGSPEDIRKLKISDSSIVRMNEGLIEKHNSKVKPKDWVYFLGDFCFRNFELVFPRLNGRITFIQGNHDKDAFQNRDKFFSYHPFGLETTINNQNVVMCHYSMRTWNRSHYGSWMLYGHSHGSLPDDPNALSFDVGVDCHNYYPLSFDDISKIMSKKTFKPIDHHKSE